MATKLGRMANDLNDQFKVELKRAMEKKFGIETETTFDFFGSMRYVTRKTDGSDFTPEHLEWLNGWETGYVNAMELVGLARDGIDFS